MIKLQMFPFSLRDVAATWFESLVVGSVNSWEELVEAYMSRFFPHALTSERRGEIIVFNQGEDESLYNAWERYKRLLKKMPNTWNRSDHSYGYFLSCYELYLQGYN